MSEGKWRIMETQIFHTICKNLKETKILQDIITLMTNLKFQHKPTNISSFKNPHIKIDLLLLLLPKGQNALKLLYSIMNLNTISFLALVEGKANN
jgi:hypothetical protein